MDFGNHSGPFLVENSEEAYERIDTHREAYLNLAVNLHSPHSSLKIVDEILEYELGCVAQYVIDDLEREHAEIRM